MKVFVVSKNSDPVEGRGRRYPVAVTLNNSGVRFPYSAEEYVLITNTGQPQAMKAFAEISKLSEEARQAIGMDFNKMAALKKQAEPDAPIKEGSTVYLSLYNGEDGMGAARVTGVYTWERNDDAFERPLALQVSQDLQRHIDLEQKRSIASEIGSLSPETRKLLGLKP